MKFDKELLVGFALCALILFGWAPLSRYMGWDNTPAAESSAPAAPAAETPAPAEKKTVPQTALPVQKAVPEVPAKVAYVAPFVIENDDVIYHIDPMAGNVSSITMKKFLNAERTAPIELAQKNGDFSVYSPKNSWKLLNVAVRKGKSSADVIRTMQTVDGKIFQIQQSWQLAAKGYAADFQLTMRNMEKQPLMLGEFFLNGGNLAPWAEVSGDTIRVASHRFDFLTVKNKFVDIDADDDDDDFYVLPSPVVKWAGLGNKYFASILAAENGSFTLRQVRTPIEGKKNAYVISAEAVFSNMTLPAASGETFRFRCYNGPKETELLAAFEPGCVRMMHLAWGPLDYLARLLLWMLVKLHGWIGSYGWSIILLTLIVRTIFYPVTAKANVSMKKMQAVGPKIQALREKYKDNPQILNMKTMGLYREEKVNPFGGCLPILLQIPVFFALYATLEGAVQLRQVPFLWCKDLAGPDTIFTIPLYFVNLPFNPLVLAMTGLMIIQQRMTPMSADPMQKKMMMAMPIVMLLFLYNLPSGLTLYWTVSNLFSIVQLKLQQRTTTPAAAKEA